MPTIKFDIPKSHSCFGCLLKVCAGKDFRGDSEGEKCLYFDEIIERDNRLQSCKDKFGE